MPHIAVAISRSLNDRTFQLLRDRPRYLSIKRIARETGLSESWLRHYATGSARAPDVDCVETRSIYFTGRTLDV